MKKLLFLIACCMHSMTLSNIKTFINNTNYTYTVMVTESNRQKTSIVVPPGSSQEMFLKTTEILKITLKKTAAQGHYFSGITHQNFTSKDYPINTNSVFIIEKNSHMKMYETISSLDKALEKISELYRTGMPIPPLHVAIHNNISSRGVHEQTLEFYLVEEEIESLSKGKSAH